MAEPTIAYSAERCFVKDEDLATWWVVSKTTMGVAREVRGPCPKCGHETQGEVDPEAFGTGQASLTAPNPIDWMTRIFTCACGVGHTKPGDGAETMPSCGRWWLMSIWARTDTADQPIRAAYDDSLLDAATAVQAAAATEAESVRTSAEKWIAGVTALFGLFGLSGVALGKDGVAAMPAPGKAVAGIVVVLALVASAFAIVLSYRAAYGWPVIVDLGNDEKLRKWYDSRRLRLGIAAQDLKWGVRWALIALAGLALAVALVLFWPTDPPKPLIRVTRTDDSDVCGKLLDSAAKSQIRVKKTNGDVVPLSFADLKTVKVAKKCEAG